MNNNDFISCIKNSIRYNIDKEYTEYKQSCLADLDEKLEAKRNDVVRQILDGIDVVMTSADYSCEPVIQIKINRTIKM